MSQAEMERELPDKVWTTTCGGALFPDFRLERDAKRTLVSRRGLGVDATYQFSSANEFIVNYGPLRSIYFPVEQIDNNTIVLNDTAGYSSAKRCMYRRSV